MSQACAVPIRGGEKRAAARSPGSRIWDHLARKFLRWRGLKDAAQHKTRRVLNCFPSIRD